MRNQTGFNQWASEYDNSVSDTESNNSYPFAGYSNVLDCVYDAIKSGKGKTVLDIGFGTGTLTNRLYDAGYKIYGIDFSEEMINIAKVKMPDAVFLNSDFSCGLPEELKNLKFDYIISTYALHHLTDTDKIAFLNVLKNNLTKNGYIIIGDVSFITEKDLNDCKNEYIEDWDNDEFYWIADKFRKELTDFAFNYKQISKCAGVYILKPKDKLQ